MNEIQEAIEKEIERQLVNRGIASKSYVQAEVSSAIFISNKRDDSAENQLHRHIEKEHRGPKPRERITTLEKQVKKLFALIKEKSLTYEIEMPNIPLEPGEYRLKVKQERNLPINFKGFTIKYAPNVGYYIIKPTKPHEEYLHKDLTLKTWCGEENFYKSIPTAREYILAFLKQEEENQENYYDRIARIIFDIPSSERVKDWQHNIAKKAFITISHHQPPKEDIS